MAAPAKVRMALFQPSSLILNSQRGILMISITSPTGRPAR